eukprot:366569-Chlamydomonas_euryale.AAC.7
MFELAIQHSGLKGFDALLEQPVISLMQWAFMHQRVEKRVTDPTGAKGKDYFGDPSSCLRPSMQRIRAYWTRAKRRPWFLFRQSPEPSYKDN